MDSCYIHKEKDLILFGEPNPTEQDWEKIKQDEKKKEKHGLKVY